MRRKNDFYPTPGRATEILIEEFPLFKDRIIWEPCAGKGDIADVFRPFTQVITSDIDPDMPCDFWADAARAQFYDCVPHSLMDRELAAVTNPPFLVAFEILQNLFGHDIPIALLLRISFKEPTEKRGKWLSEHPPDREITLPRISFTGDGKTDSCTCSWMCWNVEPGKGIIVDKERFNQPSGLIRC